MVSENLRPRTLSLFEGRWVCSNQRVLSGFTGPRRRQENEDMQSDKAFGACSFSNDFQFFIGLTPLDPIPMIPGDSYVT